MIPKDNYNATREFGRAVDFARQGRLEQAIEEAERLRVEGKRDVDKLYEAMANYFIQRNHFKEATIVLEKAVEINPYNKSAYIKLAESYHSRGYSWSKQAIAAFKKAMRIGFDVMDREDGRLYFNADSVCELNFLLGERWNFERMRVLSMDNVLIL